ncbi:MAG: hypothetical protein ABSF00_04855 [Candidatus Bathyarchaeia archaeon]
MLITVLRLSRPLVYAMPFYLCENCARDKVKLDLTYAGINQLWLRVSPSSEGFGPPCEFCNAPKTIYQVQIVGTTFDSENQHLEKMKTEIQQKA